MGFSISISSHSDDMWKVANRTFWWMQSVLEQWYPHDKELIEYMEMISCVHGNFLEDLWAENPNLCKRFVDALRTLSQECMTSGSAEPGSRHDRIQQLFGELLGLLERFEQQVAAH